jgi:Fe-Mn family superoxide dismutase
MNDFRDLITLVEDAGNAWLERVDLPYSQSALAPVMSKTTIEQHYGKLYKGYVDRYNSHEGDRTFNEAGAFLHRIYFTQFRSPKNGNSPKGASLALINRHFGNFMDFKKSMKEQAMALKGSNWIYLSRDGKIKVIKNHAKRNDIALLVDWWEHAWAADYGTNKAKYFDNIWRIIDWEVINRRIYSGKS